MICVKDQGLIFKMNITKILSFLPLLIGKILFLVTVAYSFPSENLPIPALGESQDDSNSTAYYKHAIQALMDYADRHIKQGVVLIAFKDDILLDKAYGYADVQNAHLNTSSTIFPIASLTKQFTAVAILRLVEKGLLDLNEPISTYLPDYQAKWISKITCHHLLTHTSGLADYTSSPKFLNFYLTKIFSTQELIGLIKDAPLLFTPGNKFEYSGSGYNFLGAIIEKVTRQPYENFLRESLFLPLQMDSTFADHSHFLSDKIAQLKQATIAKYFPQPKTKTSPTHLREINLSTAYAEACILSNVHDLFKWQKALYSGQILTFPMLEKLMTPYKNGYGYGIMISNNFGSAPVYFHDGRIYEYRSLLLYEPKRKIHIIILLNENRLNPYELARGFMSILDPYL